MRILKGIAIVAALGALTAAGLYVVSSLQTKTSNSSVSTHRVGIEKFNRTVPAEGNLKAEKATPINGPRGDTPLRIAWIKENGSRVKEGEVVVRFDQTDFQRNLIDGESDKRSADAKLASERARNKSAVQVRSRTASLAQMDLEVSRTRASRQDDDIFSRNEIVTSRIDGKLSEARVQHADKAQRIDRSIAASKIQLLEFERKAAELAIGRAQEGLERMEVTAPHDGIFVYDNSALKAGDSIYPGQGFAKLPLVETMEAEVFVLEADAMGLEEGKSASFVLESHRETRYEATIKKVDALAKRRQREVPIQYISVTLELKETDIKVMKPGQRIEATLELDAVEALVVPRQCIFEVDGDLIAYRLQDGSFEAVEVTLGPGTPGRVVIEEGLSESDRIATHDPFGRASLGEGEKDESPPAPETAP